MNKTLKNILIISGIGAALYFLWRMLSNASAAALQPSSSQSGAAVAQSAFRTNSSIAGKTVAANSDPVYLFDADSVPSISGENRAIVWTASNFNPPYAQGVIGPVPSTNNEFVRYDKALFYVVTIGPKRYLVSANKVNLA